MDQKVIDERMLDGSKGPGRNIDPAQQTNVETYDSWPFQSFGIKVQSNYYIDSRNKNSL